MSVSSVAASMEAVDLNSEQSKLYPRFPTVHGDRLAFVFDDHLWVLSDNIATRLSSGIGQVRAPLFSPDGLSIAFSAYEDDCEEVYRVGVDGSHPTRLTFTGFDCRVVAWSNDSSTVYFDSSWRQDVPCRVSLFSVPAAGGPATPVPYGKDADHLALEPNGPGVLLGRYCGDPAITEWKRYQGGRVGVLWLDRTGAGAWKKLSPVPSPGNLGCPVWCADGRLYFISDFEGVGCLYSCNTEGVDLRCHTEPTEFYVRELSTDGHKIAFHSGAQLFVYDTDSNTLQGPLPVQLRGMCMNRQPHSPLASEHLSCSTLHPEGVALAVCARGQAFAMGLWDGPVLGFSDGGLTKHDQACWLSDGNRIVMSQCDTDGEYDLVVHTLDGSAVARPLELDPEELGRPHCIVASPSKKKSCQYVAVVNHRGVLVVADVLKETLRLIDVGKHGPTETAECFTNGFSGLCWSACGTWLAYGFKDSSTTSVIKVCDSRDWSVHSVTAPVLEDVCPTFDPEGRYLYFISSREFEPQEDHMHFGMSFPQCQRPFALLLRTDVPDPFMPELRPPGFEHEDDEDDMDSDESEDDEPQPFEIDFDGIQDRIVAFDVPAGRYSSIAAYDNDNVLWVSSVASTGVDSDDEEECALEKYNFAKRKVSVLIEDALEVELSMNREVMVVMDSEDRLRVLQAGAKPGDDGDDDQEEEADCEDEEEPGRQSGYVDLDGRVTLHVVPGEEWEYVFNEAWRAMRDLFHSEAAVQGARWEACREKYANLLPHISCRAELSDLMRELMAELNTSHAFVDSPDLSVESLNKPKAPACLGGEFEWDQESNGWRLVHIVRGDVWDREKGGPLARAGLGVQVGDILVGLNRRKLCRELSPEQALVSVPTEGEVLLTFLNRRASPKKGHSQEWMEGTNVSKKKKKKKSKQPTSKSSKQKDWRSPFVKGSTGPPGTWSRRVNTIADDEAARYRDWVNGRRQEVHQASNGRLGYVHIPDMDRLGFSEFHRNYIPESSREALIVDVRYNQGGNVSELVLDKLTRRPLAMEVGRHTEPQRWPSCAPRGSMAMLVNEETSSDGDIIAKAFQTLKLGALFGKRTWGGVVGIDSDPECELIDGGEVSYPSCNTVFEGEERSIENHGVDPDTEVECTPGDFAQGKDPQLAAAIAHLLAGLAPASNSTRAAQGEQEGEI